MDCDPFIFDNEELDFKEQLHSLSQVFALKLKAKRCLSKLMILHEMRDVAIGDEKVVHFGGQQLHLIFCVLICHHVMRTFQPPKKISEIEKEVERMWKRYTGYRGACMVCPGFSLTEASEHI